MQHQQRTDTRIKARRILINSYTDHDDIYGENYFWRSPTLQQEQSCHIEEHRRQTAHKHPICYFLIKHMVYCFRTFHNDLLQASILKHKDSSGLCKLVIQVILCCREGAQRGWHYSHITAIFWAIHLPVPHTDFTVASRKKRFFKGLRHQDLSKIQAPRSSSSPSHDEVVISATTESGRSRGLLKMLSCFSILLYYRNNSAPLLRGVSVSIDNTAGCFPSRNSQTS